MTDAPAHTPVLVREVSSLLAVQPGQRVIDATIGGGGHAASLLACLGDAGAVLGIDRDPGALRIAAGRFAAAVKAGRLILVPANFRALRDIASDHGFDPVHAVLFDLGISSYHLERSGRGFSFQREEPLDMRFDPTAADSPPAARILATWPAEDLAALLRQYGEERFSRRVARSITAGRPVTTTTQLRNIVVQALPGRYRARADRSVARVFQALRIVVNEELDALEDALPQAFRLLVPGGRIAVIAFHSLEDRLVKRAFLAGREAGTLKVITKRPVRPTDAEILANPRAASARLRVAEKAA